VTFALRESGLSAPIRYAELARALGVAEGERAPLARVRETVIALRRGKGMVLDATDPDTASAGSFFTNPILDAAALDALRDRVKPLLKPAEAMPVFPEAGGRAKVSAAWLIERAGFTRGYAAGHVAISSKHALALTNRGGATTRELLALARTIRDGVQSKFGVTLENEPVFVGVAL
jgi:UDP-N-acetylmuramate dehydrogenase